jgi:hypothetical protein
MEFGLLGTPKDVKNIHIIFIISSLLLYFFFVNCIHQGKIFLPITICLEGNETKGCTDVVEV